MVVKNALPMQEMDGAQVRSLVWKIHWKRAWQPTLVFWLGESYGLKYLVDYIVHGVTKTKTKTYMYIFSELPWWLRW